ncbi:MAG: HD domain-containing protein [Nitrospirae bacterium]|nr:HD domain-containing protein [Nitrospirota bacterium]MCL5421216.1 HD domain-containing protein [Nitrospirota bacterium]
MTESFREDDRKMTHKDLISFRSWFSDFCRSFYSAHEEDQRNILLKEEHTRNVRGNMRRICGELSLSSEGILLAETIALFHDTGRFPQYAEYKTFIDAVSVNHALLGVEILNEKKVLADLPEKEQELVLQAVKFHNVYALPDIEDDEGLFFLKLIRDADKLDIWRVFIEYYEAPPEERASAVGLGLPEGAGYSEEVLSSLYEKRVVSLSSLKTLDDFKLLQLSWIYDLNFKASLKLLLAGNYIDRIVRTLPRSDEIRRVPPFLREYIHQRLQEDGP